MGALQLWLQSFLSRICNANANSQCLALSTFQMHSYGLVSCAMLLTITHHGRTELTTSGPLPSYSTSGKGFTSKGRLLFPSLGLINNPKETHWVTSSTHL